MPTNSFSGQPLEGSKFFEADRVMIESRCQSMAAPRYQKSTRLDDLCYDIQKSQVGSREGKKAANINFFEARSLMLRYRNSQVDREMQKK